MPDSHDEVRSAEAKLAAVRFAATNMDGLRLAPAKFAEMRLADWNVHGKIGGCEVDRICHGKEEKTRISKIDGREVGITQVGGSKIHRNESWRAQSGQY